MLLYRQAEDEAKRASMRNKIYRPPAGSKPAARPQRRGMTMEEAQAFMASSAMLDS